MRVAARSGESSSGNGISARTRESALLRMILMTFRRLVPGLAVMLGACGSEPTGPTARGSAFQYSFSDPVGDTLPPPANVLQRALDVHQLDVGLTADSIFIRIDFTGSISRWSQLALNSIDGFIDFDFDDNPGTGYPAATQEFGSVDAQMGVESYISLRDDGNGHLLRRDGEASQWANVNVAFGERSVTIRFARADVGETDGVFRVSAMIGGTNRWITDLVPANGHHRISSR